MYIIAGRYDKLIGLKVVLLGTTLFLSIYDWFGMFKSKNLPRLEIDNQTFFRVGPHQNIIKNNIK